MKDLITELRKMHRRTFSEMDEDVKNICIFVIAVCAYIAAGLWIKGKIDAWQMEQNAIYTKALQIESDEAYKYAADTSVGYAYGYGKLEAIHPVSVPEIEGSYMLIERVQEHYTQHVRTYTTTDSKGRTQVHTEIYYSWDVVDSAHWHSDYVLFKEIEIDYGELSGIHSRTIDTIYLSGVDRYIFYGANSTLEGTMFGDLKDGTVKGARFHEGNSIQETVKADVSTNAGVIFAVLWVVVPVVVIAVLR